MLIVGDKVMSAEAEDVATATPKEAAVVEKVTMTDGRVVDFKGKRKMLKDYVVADDGTVTATFDFRNGQTRKLVIREDMKNQFAGHGAVQKVGDETAGESEVDDMVIAVDDIIGRLDQGEWTVQRAGGGFAGTSVLLKALVELSGKDPADVQAFLKGMPKAERDVLADSPRIKPVIDRIKAEKLAKGPKIDVDEKLAGLGI